jgi:hypothetical protein
MIHNEFDISELHNILNYLNYYENFKNKHLNNSFNCIDYGSKLGILTFDSFFDAANKYVYSRQVEETVFAEWHDVLNDEKATEEALFCVILEIFVWGDVLNGNVKKAIQLYKERRIKNYIGNIKNLLTSEMIIPQTKRNESFISDNELIWSSGWTKVYSIINNDFLIYDSRVSAFLNHTLTYGCDYSEEQLERLKNLTKYLFNFEGEKKRARLVDKNKYGLKNYKPSGLKGFNANLIASWVIKLLKENLSLNQDFRMFERAFFMLGFDLDQLRQTN